jgi:hypothetical protein
MMKHFGDLLPPAVDSETEEEQEETDVIDGLKKAILVSMWYLIGIVLSSSKRLTYMSTC